MIRTRLLMILLIAVASLGISGCMQEVYVFDFTMEEDLQRNDGDWELLLQGNPNESGYKHTSLGMIIDGYYLIAPHKYIGDFSMTVDFLLNVYSESVAHCWVYLSNNWTIDPYFTGLLMAYLGHDTWEEAYIMDGFFDVLTGPIDPIPGLVKNGPNRVKIDKRGDKFSYTLNGKPLASNMVLINNPLDEYIPLFLGIQLTPIEDVYSLIFQRVEIRYSGEQVPR